MTARATPAQGSARHAGRAQKRPPRGGGSGAARFACEPGVANECALPQPFPKNPLNRLRNPLKSLSPPTGPSWNAPSEARP